MKSPQNKLIVLCLLFALQCTESFAMEYHIDSQKDFADLSSATFQSGDLILFKRGVRFAGMFSPSG